MGLFGCRPPKPLGLRRLKGMVPLTIAKIPPEIVVFRRRTAFSSRSSPFSDDEQRSSIEF
jgi:hypothetical protein